MAFKWHVWHDPTRMTVNVSIYYDVSLPPQDLIRRYWLPGCAHEPASWVEIHPGERYPTAVLIPIEHLDRGPAELKQVLMDLASKTDMLGQERVENLKAALELIAGDTR